MNPKHRRPPAPTSRDLGLVSADAGKGDAIRNLSPKFRANYDEIDWKRNQSDNNHKFKKTYR